ALGRNLARRVGRNPDNLRAFSLELLEREQNRRVFDFGGDDSRLGPVGSREERALDSRGIGLGPRCREGDLLGLAFEQARYRGASTVQSGAQLASSAVNARGVAGEGLQGLGTVAQSLGHLRPEWRGGVVVQVDHN